jgi:protoporphyrinogen oxidase
VGFCHNFAPANAPKGASSLYAEISYSRERPLNKAQAPEWVRRGLMDMGILRPKDKISARFIADIPDAYVVYDSHRSAALSTIQGFLRENGVISTGRWGAWEYGSMEDALWQGMEAAGAKP